MNSLQQLPENFGKYKVIDLLGSGGYADVYLVENTELERREALKILKQRWLHDPMFVQNFQTEAKAAAKFQHPNIIIIYEQGELNNRFYISVEYLSGGTLEDRLQKTGPLSPQRAAEFIRQIASALDYAHQRKTIHRDIKPSNILIRSDPRGGEQAVLSDFGIAKALQESSGQHSTSIIGTPSYLSPEQILTPGKIDQRADIYALGVVAYQLLTGEPPFKQEDGESFIQLADRINKKTPLSLQSRGLHGEIERAIFKALEKHPDDRYESAGAFATNLDKSVQIWQEESGEEELMVTLSGMAVKAMSEHRWDDAVKYWKQFLAIAPDGATIATNGLLEAEKQIRIRELRDQAQQCEAQQDWAGAVAALSELLLILPHDETFQQQLSRARMQQELKTLYAQTQMALDQHLWDDAIELAQQIEKRSPDYQDIQILRDRATAQKVTELKDNAWVAIGERQADQALAIVQQIRSADPVYQFCAKAQIEQIIQMADRLHKEAQAEVERLNREKEAAEQAQLAAEARQKKQRTIAFFGSVLLLLLLLGAGGLVMSGWLNDDDPDAIPTPLALIPDPTRTSTATAVSPSQTPAPTQTPTSLPTVTSTSTATATASPSATPTSSPTTSPSPTPTPTPTPETAVTLSVILPATVYAGPDTSYAELTELPVGARATILGRTTNRSWWFIQSAAGTQGWIAASRVQASENASAVPVITPNAAPPTPQTVRITPSPIQTETPLTLTANWPVGDAECFGLTGFSVDYWMEASGGNGRYTYILGDQVIAQNIASGVTHRISSTGGSYVTTLIVRSGSQEIRQDIYVDRSPWCED